MMHRRGYIDASMRCLRRLSKDRESLEKVSRLIVAKWVALGGAARLSCNPLTVVIGKLHVSPRILWEYDHCRGLE